MLERKPRSRIFRGFSTVDRIKPVTQLIDIDLIKQDLLNHFHTIPGERVMRPTFGSVIWDYLFEPFTESAVEDILENTRAVIANDSRVELQDLRLTEYEHGIKIEIDLFYLGIDAAGTFEVSFDRRNNLVNTESTEEFV